MATADNSRRGSNRLLLGLLILALSLIGLYIALKLFLQRRKGTGAIQDQEANELPQNIVTFHRMVQETLPEIDETTRRIITAQAMHESGVFTSTVYNENANAFGMRLAKVRETSAAGENNGYAFYDSISDSVIDLQLWFDYHNLPLSFADPQSYAEKIKEKGYYEASFESYSKALTAHFNKVNKVL